MNKVERAQVGVGDLGIVGVGCVGGGGVCYNALESRAANANVILGFVFLGPPSGKELKKKRAKNEKYFSDKIYSSL